MQARQGGFRHEGPAGESPIPAPRLGARAGGRARRARRADDIAPLVLAAKQSAVRQWPRLLRQSRQAPGRRWPRRSDRRPVLSRQSARPGDRRRQLGQPRRHRSHGHRHLDLGECRAPDRAPRPRLSVRELPAADQGARRRRGEAARAGAQNRRQCGDHRLGLQFRLTQRALQVAGQRARGPGGQAHPDLAQQNHHRMRAADGSGGDAAGVRRDLHRPPGRSSGRAGT